LGNTTPRELPNLRTLSSSMRPPRYYYCNNIARPAQPRFI
jgi:hypothetical protein